MRGSRALGRVSGRTLWQAFGVVALLGCTLASPPLLAQADDQAPPAPKPRFRLGGEMKIHGRYTDELEVRSDFPFPGSFIPPGQSAVFLRTPEPGFSREISTVTLIGEMNLDPGIEGRLEVNSEDLSNGTPPPSADSLQLREP